MASKQARILVVDDAPLMRKMLEEVLKRFGYLVDSTENGQQAIEYFINHRPDLILMDADMPVMDGVTACEQIRALPEAKHLPIIIVTAFVGREWVDRAYAAGATDFITKPVNWDVLRNRIHYILKAKRSEEALFDEKEKALVTLASIGDGVITTDAQGCIEYLNPIATKLTGWTEQEAMGLPLDQVVSIFDERTQNPLQFPLKTCLKKGQLIEHKGIVLVHKERQQQFAVEDSAAPIRDRNGHIIGVVLVFHDVTENRKMTQELAYQATHDALTGLYNRNNFNMHLHALLDRIRNDGRQHALFYLDLDQFKIVNDTCGHEAGDRLLKDVALSLQETTKFYENLYEQAFLARLGGDEFALLLENCILDNALTIANTLCDKIQDIRFFWTDGKEQEPNEHVFTIGVSIGVVPLPNQTTNPRNALAMADAACYAAKNSGRSRIHIYAEEDMLNEIKWVAVINENLENNTGLYLFNQIIQPLHQETQPQPCYYEVLLRMDNKKNALVPPGAFLSAAARYDLMPILDLWVIRSLLEWLSQESQHLDNLYLVGINISNYSLDDKKFLQEVINLIKKYHIPTHKICFEIAETTVISNFKTTKDFILRLKEEGCLFALDNFGSGIASVNYLKRLPVDLIKLDCGLVKKIADDKVNYMMLETINNIAHTLGIKTIAECVENETILAKLYDIKVDYVQGYLIGEPEFLNKDNT